jgi:YgiT-type zinc finger domain-containing protein
MEKGEASPNWLGLGEAIMVGMDEWRQQNPQATFREIEEELDRRLSELRARMLADLAISSAKAEWKKGAGAPKCPNCGAVLEAKGKKKRTLQTRGGRGVELEREYGVCPKCGQGLFPPG